MAGRNETDRSKGGQDMEGMRTGTFRNGWTAMVSKQNR